MKKFIFPLTLLLLCAGTAVFAQSGQMGKGDAAFDRMYYPAAIKAYEKVLKKETENVKAMEKLAEAYRKVGNTQKAEMYYGMASRNAASSPSTKFWYGQMLKSNGKTEEAKKAFEAYEKTGDNRDRAAKALLGLEASAKIKADSGRYSIGKVNFNSVQSDFGPTFYNSGLIFASSRNRGFRIRPINLRNNNLFYDLYMVGPDPKTGAMGEPSYLKGKVNTRFHDGPAVIGPENDIMYFTRSNFINGKLKKDAKGVNNLKILTAKPSAGKWIDIQVLPFNSDEYSCGHPAISADGQVLVFTSDMPGGKGGSDLWMVRKSGESWGKPENLGANVNSSGDESFPHFLGNDILFFSSNGHNGLGGLDVFSSQKQGSTWSVAENAGYPLNSSMDDFGVMWIKGKTSGYLSSNRSSGAGEDDIYTFTRRMSIDGQIVDSRTRKPVPGAKVTVMDVNNKISVYKADAEGKFRHYAEWGKDYFVTVDMEEYKTRKEKLSTKTSSPTEDLKSIIDIERELVYSAYGIVKDSETGQPISGAEVRVIGEGPERTVSTDASGKYFTTLEPENDYNLVVVKPGYMPEIVEFSTRGRYEPIDFVNDITLKKGDFMLVEGKVIRKKNRLPLKGATVRLINTTEQKEQKAAISRTDGRFFMVYPPDSSLLLLVSSKEGYFSARYELPTIDSVGINSTLRPEIEMVALEVGELVKGIYYDYNKSDITISASKELFEIVYFMKDNPTAVVELSAHTDSRGGNPYNQKLSQQRAEAAVKFITARGVDKAKITARGYGESQLVNKCKDNVPCVDQEHQMNRRCEIRVTGITPIAPEN